MDCFEPLTVILASGLRVAVPMTPGSRAAAGSSGANSRGVAPSLPSGDGRSLGRRSRGASGFGSSYAMMGSRSSA